MVQDLLVRHDSLSQFHISEFDVWLFCIFCINNSCIILYVLQPWAKNIYFAIYLLVFPLSVFKAASCKLKSKLQNNLLKSFFRKILVITDFFHFFFFYFFKKKSIVPLFLYKRSKINLLYKYVKTIESNILAGLCLKKLPLCWWL